MNAVAIVYIELIVCRIWVTKNKFEHAAKLGLGVEIVIDFGMETFSESFYCQ